MTQTLKTTERLGVVDALRGFALLAIVLLHNLEHYNLFLPLDYTLPAWLQTIDKYAWDTMFFLFAGRHTLHSLYCSDLVSISSSIMRKSGELTSADVLHGGCVCFSCLRSCMPCSITGIFFYSMQ